MRVLIPASVTLLLAACASQYDHAPLIFGQAHSLGVSIGTNPANQTPELNLGFKDMDIAIVPTVGGVGANGLIQGKVDGGIDAYSTFGQFSTTVEGTSVGLGKFFATGNAAVALGDGFGCKAAGYSGKECVGRANP
jgi:hypothetical protein